MRKPRFYFCKPKGNYFFFTFSSSKFIFAICAFQYFLFICFTHRVSMWVSLTLLTCFICINDPRTSFPVWTWLVSYVGVMLRPVFFRFSMDSRPACSSIVSRACIYAEEKTNNLWVSRGTSEWNCFVFLSLLLLCVFSIPDRYKQKHNSKTADSGIRPWCHLPLAWTLGLHEWQGLPRLSAIKKGLTSASWH